MKVSPWGNKRDIYLKGNCYVLRKRRVVYFAITKNGSETLKHALAIRDSEVLYKDIAETRIKNFFKLAIVREPVERFVSAYIYLCWRFGRGEKGVLTLPHFDDFLCRVCKYGPYFNRHIYPQWYFLTDDNGQLFPVNLFVDLKRLDERWDIVNQILNLPSRPVRKNVSSSKHRKLVDSWLAADRGSRERAIKRVYKKDVELYAHLNDLK